MIRIELKVTSIAILFFLSSCISNGGAKISSTQQNYNSIEAQINQVKDSDSDLRQVYINAIQEFIKSVHVNNSTSLETISLINRQNGQPDDFPSIEMPKDIDGVKIVMLTQEESERNQTKFSKTSPCINMVGEISELKSEFTFITFFPEFKHQFDAYIDFELDKTSRSNKLIKNTIEKLIYNKNAEPSHYSIYENGRHIEDKPI